MESIETLDEIGIRCQTDKATSFNRTYAKPKGYTVHYDRAFQALRNDPIKFLEIGIAGGESIRMWMEYFPNAKIFGVDNVRDTNQWNMPGTTGRYTAVYGDQGDETFWKCFVADYGKDWDVIVDDGSHMAKDVLATWFVMWRHLKPKGLYCIEDLACAYSSIFKTAASGTAMTMLVSVIGDMHNGDTEYESVLFTRELAIIQKK